MRKLEISDPEIMGVAIRQEIERNDESRYDHRLHGLLLVANGMSARQAALWLSESERTVQRWVARYRGRRPLIRSRIGAGITGQGSLSSGWTYGVAAAITTPPPVMTATISVVACAHPIDPCLL